MSSGYSGRRFECPFFKWDERAKIHCEGGIIALPRAEFTTFVERYCASLEGWKGCPMARALNRYYEKK